MTENPDRINLLLDKLEILLRKQDSFQKEISDLKVEINNLKSPDAEPPIIVEPPIIREEQQTITKPVQEKVETVYTPILPPVKNKDESVNSPFIITKPPKAKSDIEKFIGENLINKIGIAITIIGVAIGAKYSIEHQLISPLTRIILGYLMGLGLLGFGIKLKMKYENYSAVLVSGAIAILYFITYSAYSFYGLIPQVFAFALMVVFTGFTVVAAINYNKQVIAHIGLVGAYAVPFLLSEGSGQVAILFSYITVINIGILILAFKKYWKPLYYVSFLLTWAIFFSWYIFNYQVNIHFALSLIFLSVFFATFYLIFLAYKLIRKQKFQIEDVLLLLANSFVFYGLGYVILSEHKTGRELLGVFTLCNALIHFLVSTLIYRQKLADRNVFFLIAGLVLVFITIAIPVQLSGNWVTLLWAAEAALLFWIGRTKNVPFYEKLSYALMLLAFFSIVHDWQINYGTYISGQPETRIKPLLNINFLSSLLFIGFFTFINYVNNTKKQVSLLSPIVNFCAPAILLAVLYYSFRIEIATYWDQLYTDSIIKIKVAADPQYFDDYFNYDLRYFRSVWIINYSLFFLSVLSWVNIKKLRNTALGVINIGLNALTVVIFLIQGIPIFIELRESYLDQTLPQYYNTSYFNIGIRYISFALVALILTSTYKYLKQDFIKTGSFNLKIPFDFLLHISVICMVSNELVTLMNMMNMNGSYKLGLSILWGVYSLFLIILGIWKNKKHLRIGAIILFTVTLIKLFIYDIADLNTIAKTIVFVSLGILLLIISFLYNKYKNLISKENES
ncbi:MAG: DUF2339 domain-containing protein [Daejeonella sp.]